MNRARQPGAAAARRFVAEVVQRHCGERATSRNWRVTATAAASPGTGCGSRADST